MMKIGLTFKDKSSSIDTETAFLKSHMDCVCTKQIGITEINIVTVKNTEK